MMAGLIGSMLAGAAQGAGAATEKVGGEMLRGSILSELKAQEAEIQKERDARVAETQKELARYQDELRRAPAKEAMAGIEKANAPVSVDDGQGGATMQAPPEAEQRANIKKGLIGSGSPELMSAGVQMDERDQDRKVRREELAQREAADERRHLDVTKRLDQQFAHQQKQDSIAASNASRMLMIAEEQTKGLRLDNEQKQQLADLDKQWREATDDKTREGIAQRRALLTGKWNESFEVKVGKDGLGNDTVLGYIDKRRGTFTTTDGTVTDMRTGQKVSTAAPYPEGAEIKNKATGQIYVVKNGVPVLKEGEKPKASSERRESPSMKPTATTEVSAYGPLTSWDTIERAVRAGDQAAITYAKDRIRRGPGIVGVEPPESLTEYLRALDAS